jgi:hypothetical protein
VEAAGMSRRATVFLAATALALAISVLIYTVLGSGAGVRTAGMALFSFDPEDILEVKVTDGEESFEIKKSDLGWQIGPQPLDQASAAAVKKLIECARATHLMDCLDQHILPLLRVDPADVDEHQLAFPDAEFLP